MYINLPPFDIYILRSLDARAQESDTYIPDYTRAAGLLVEARSNSLLFKLSLCSLSLFHSISLAVARSLDMPRQSFRSAPAIVAFSHGFRRSRVSFSNGFALSSFYPVYI